MPDIKEYNRKYYLEHREERKEKHRRSSARYSLEHREEINRKRRKPSWIRQTADDIRDYNRNYERELKKEVLTHYGNGKLACVKCSFSDLRALSIDHVNGNGNKHRREIKINICKWLKRNDYPLGYQTLCMNCQWIKKSDETKRRS